VRNHSQKSRVVDGKRNKLLFTYSHHIQTIIEKILGLLIKWEFVEFFVKNKSITEKSVIFREIFSYDRR
jgi:hypothetical protein